MKSRHKAKIIISAMALMLLSPALVLAAPEKPLTVVSWGGSYTRSQMLAYVKPYRKQNNEWVQMETYNGGLNEIRRQVETENVVWDVVDFELSDLIRGCREGLLEKIDHATLPPGSDGTPANQDFIDGAFTECGVGQTIWSTVVAFNAERLNDPRPSKLADFFDVTTYPGGRGIRRDPRVIMEWALMADGVAPAEVYKMLETDQGQRRAFGVMDRIKTKIVWWSSGEDPIKLLDSGSVSMTSVWNGRMYRPIAEKGKPYAILWDGQIWDIDSWGIPKGTFNLEKAMDFIRFSTSSKQLAEQTRYITYGPARKSSMTMVAPQTKGLLPTATENMANALQTDADWWATHHVALRARFEQWLATGRGLSGTAR